MQVFIPSQQEFNFLFISLNIATNGIKVQNENHNLWQEK